MQFRGGENDNIKIVRMNKQKDGTFDFAYCELVNEEIENVMTINLKRGEVEVM